MGVGTGTKGIGQYHTVQPGMNNSVTRFQGNTSPALTKVGQASVHLNIGRLRIGRGMTKALHQEICTETQRCKLLHFVTGHGTCGIL